MLAGIITDFGSPTGAVRVRRARRVRRRDDRRVPQPARRRPVHRRGSARVRHALGRRQRPASSSKTATSTCATAWCGGASSEIRADGLFSLGYPRQDGGEEINARVRVARRDLDSLRHAFGIDDYPVSGLLSGEFHLTGEYQRPIGFGAMTIDDGVGYGEPFQKATASLRFDGAGVRLDDLALAKGAGTVTGAAFVGWDSTYSFNVDGRRIPVERARVPRVSERAAVGDGRGDGQRQRHVRRAAQRLPVPRQRSVRRRGRGRAGHRHARAARHRAERRDRRRVAAAGAHRHRAHRAHAAGRLRAHVPVPRQLARSVRAAVRAAPLAVHDRGRQRVDPRRRRAGRFRSTCSSTARSTRSTCGCSTTR